MTTHPSQLDSLCNQLDSIRNELRLIARAQRRAGNKDMAGEIDADADKLTEVADHITSFIAPYLK